MPRRPGTDCWSRPTGACAAAGRSSTPCADALAEPARTVTLTLLIAQRPQPYVLAFSVIGRDAAEGRIQDSPTASRPLKLARSAQK